MGAASSSASEKTTTDDGARAGGDDAAFDRVRKTGMPFSLLHDETFLLQKYQEIVRGIAKKDGDSATTHQLVMTGVDDIPVGERKQMQDASWRNVFTSQRSSGESGEASTMHSAHSVMRDTSLARSSLDRIASETRREQQTGIVQDYLAQLVVKMEQRAIANQAKDRLWTQEHGSDHQPAGDDSVDDSAKRNSSRRTSLSAVAAARGLFKVGSFAMNLRMLSGFRVSMPTVFEDGVLALIETVLEFPPFVLHGTDASKMNDSDAAATALLVDDAHRFSEKLLQQSDLSPTHRDLLLVLVLSLGVCSGRASYLLEFATSVFGESFAQTVPLSGSLGEWSTHELVETILMRLESFRIHYDLGRLETSSRTAEVYIKAVDQGTSIDSSPQQRPHSVATDGTYVYVWNIDSGLQKIGTGLNYTVAGRVYVSVPSHRYRNQIRAKKPQFLASFIGSAEEVTERVRHVIQQEADAMATNTIRELVGNATSSDSPSRKLYVQYRDSSRLYDESEFLETQGSVTDAAGSVRFAVFGEFVSLSPEAVQALYAASLSLSIEGQAKGVEVDATLLLDFYARCGMDDKILTGDEQLIVVSSATSSSPAVAIEKYSLGRTLEGYEDGGEVYYSSLTLAAGKLYLSQLTPLSLEGESEPQLDCIHPRSLLVISPDDLKVEKAVQVSSVDADQSSFTVADGVTRPLFTYTSEGNQLYEIEITTAQFVVRVFSVLAQSGADQLTFIRTYAVDIKDCTSEGFVDGLAVFLELLKSDLHVSEMGFTIPSFYTNGSYLCAVLPRVSDDTANPKYDCALCKYEGDVPDSASPSHVITKSKITDVYSWAEPVSGCCFDPFNNVVWILNKSKGGLDAFRNSGKKINVIAETEDDAVGRSNEPEPESVQPRELADVAALRVLSFFAKHADIDVSSDVPGAVQPFDATLDAPSLVKVLEVATRLATTRHAGKATTMEQRVLDCCLRVLVRTLRDTVDASGTTASTLLPLLHSGLPPVLSLVTASADAKTDDDRAVKLDLRIVAKAIEMNASTMQLAEGGLASQLDQLVKWATKSKSASFSPMDTLLATSLMDQFQRAIARVDGLTLLPLESQFENLWNELVAVEVEVLGRVSTVHSSHLRSQVHRELLSTVATFVQILFVRAGENLEMFRFATRAFNNICRGLCTAVDAATKAATVNSVNDQLLGEGALLQITPTVLVPVTHGLRLAFGVNSDSVREEIRQELRKVLLEDLEEVSALFKSLNQLSEVLNAEAKVVKIQLVETVKHSKVMESGHEYSNDLDYTTELRIPGAKKITITFDDRTRTENEYDYVVFYKDKDRDGYYGQSKYTGRDADAQWPGLGQLAPLVINSDHCYVRFVSDGSNTDWGFKFTAIAEVQEKTVVVERHWASALSEMALGVLVEVSKILLKGTPLVPITSVEARNDAMLRHDLLHYGLASEAEQSAGAVSLLREFVAASDGSDAKRLIVALKQKSTNPRLLHRGSSSKEKNPVNVAIQAAAAAILHHNRQGVDAYAFAQNLRDDVPDELVQAWRVAQKMRDWFHVGDAAEAARLKIGSSSTRSSRQLKRQPSAYAGMADEALDALTKAVIERAQFLLELTPSALPGSSVSRHRWSALAKYAPALRIANADVPTLSSLGKWYNAVDALKEPRQLRSLLQYQRSTSERLKHPAASKSINEKVLEFLQSDIDVSEVREAIKARNQRAAYRSAGLNLLARTMESTLSVSTKSIFVDTYSSCLSAMVTRASEAIANASEPEGGVVVASTPLHVSSMLGGCSTHLGRDLSHTLKAWVFKLSSELDAYVNGKDDSASTEYASLVLKALCIDYEAEDASLLLESGLIDRLRRLLGCKSLRIRRSAQVLLDILLLRLGERRSSASDEESLVQQQLYDTIGHQLNEATMAMCTTDKTDAGCSSVYDISRGVASRTLALLEKDEIQWNHSIMAWVYVPSDQSTYALQLGDEVRPGPTFSASQKVKGNGVVSAILSPTAVRVRWHPSGVESEHEFDPSTGKKDVILAESGAGGVVFGKGAINLDRGSEFARPWSHFGLYLDDQYQVSYKISCGTDKECVYETKHALKTGAWSHVAVVQREAELVVFVNGEKVSQHELDPFLVLEDGYCAAESRIVESIHPVPRNRDHFYGVQFPVASKIRVAFDPLCATDESTGKLRFFKHPETTDQWCEQKKLGVDVTGSMVIPSDYFRIQLDKGKGEGYGFRLLATPAFSDRAPPTRVLNPHPLYIGAPPARVANDVAAKCWVSTPMTVNEPLDGEAIVVMMTSSRPANETPQDFPVDQALYVLGLVQRSLSSPMGRKVIAIPRNIERVLQLAFDDLVPVEVRCAAVAVLKQLGSSVEAKLLNECFKRFVTVSSDSRSIVDFVFDALVRVNDVWSPPNDSSVSQTKVSAHESQTVGAAYSSLLRSLARHDIWRQEAKTLIESVVTEWEGFLAHRDEQSDFGSSGSRMITVLSLFGGNFASVTSGGRVKCHIRVHNAEMMETGYLIRYEQRGGERVARVLLDSDVAKPLLLTSKSVLYLADEDNVELEAFVATILPELFNGSLHRFFAHQLPGMASDAINVTTRFERKTLLIKNAYVHESAHPYSMEDVITHVLFNNAKEVEITFDSTTELIGPDDYMQFIKRSDDKRSPLHPESGNGKPYWGEEKYTGTKFPGVGDVPPLRIPAACFDMRFYAEVEGGWGFKVYMRAIEERIVYGPESPPSPTVYAMNEMRSRAMKALRTCVGMLPSASQSSLLPVLPQLLSIANAEDDGRATQLATKWKEFESSHPYKSTDKQYVDVCFPGASRLSIVFDDRSETSGDRDFITFFKDRSLTDFWGEKEYASSGSNWPGALGPVLVIPADSFTFYSASPNDSSMWGWKFTVTAEFPMATPLISPLDQLEQQAHDLWSLNYEGPVRQATPQGSWGQSDAQEVPALDCTHEAVPSSTESVPIAEHGESTRGGMRRISRVRAHTEDPIDVFESASENAPVVGRFSHGHVATVVEEVTGWFKISLVNGVGEEAATVNGWVKQRAGDDLRVMDFDAWLETEESVIIGVDDSDIALVSVESASEIEAVGVRRSGFTTEYPCVSLGGHESRLASLGYDVHRALAIKYARSVVSSLLVGDLAASPTDRPLSLGDLGSTQEVLQVLSRALVDGEVVDEAVLEQRVVRMLVAPESQDQACTLVDEYVRKLEGATRSWRQQRTVLLELESQHPYTRDLDEYTSVMIPGAKKICVYFDPRTQTEAICDYVTFFKSGSDRSERYGMDRYSGRNQAANWPGVDGRPPLVIDADSFEVYFHTDSYLFDWGYKIFAVGVFDSDDEVVSSIDAVSPSLLDLRVALWGINAATKACLARDFSDCAVASFVYSTRVMELVVRCLQNSPVRVRLATLQLLVTLAQRGSFIRQLPLPLVQALWRSLEASGRALKEEPISEQFKLLVEAMVAVDLALDSGRFCDLQDSTPRSQTQLIRRVAPRWYEAIRDSVATLLDFQDSRQLAVEACGSEHPLSIVPQKQNERKHISIDGAVALEIRFDRKTSLANHDRLQFFTPESDTSEVVQGLCGSKCDTKYPALFVTEQRALETGDRVVRCASWRYGDEDGGAGHVGVVEEIVSWRGEEGMGVRVRWESSDVGVYRYGYFGHYDVELVLEPNARTTPLVIRGSSLEYTFEVVGEGQEQEQEPSWGYLFYVIPHFTLESIGRERFQTRAYQTVTHGTPADVRHDQQLIKYVNKVAQQKAYSGEQLLSFSWPSIAPSAEELVKWPVLVEMMTGTAPRLVTSEEDATEAPIGGDFDASSARLGERFVLLQRLNRALKTLIPYVKFTASTIVQVGRQDRLQSATTSTPALLQLRKLVIDQRYRMMYPAKRELLNSVLERTQEKWADIDITFNRLKAMRHRVSGKTDSDGHFALFSQAFRRLSTVPDGHFRRATALYKVYFLGENAQDAGGPYRETLAQFTEELHSPQLPLLVTSSNALHNVGAAREKWVLNPSSTSATALKMFEFLGKLMGAAMRSQDYMPLQIATLIWKKLAGETVTTDDLALVDSMIVNAMEKIRTIDQCGVTADEFEDIVMETFTTLSTDNRTVALKPNGASIPVTFDSRGEFADLVEAYRLREFDVQIETILRGLATVVPVHLLSLFTGVEMELMVCGSPEVDVDLLQRCTEYSGCRATDDHIVWFWQVQRAFSHEERSAFLRFVWGRSRLPANEKEFPQRFKLQSFNKTVNGSVDKYLPISHTCFFSVEMPQYSSAEVLRERLLYAMYNCQEIDGDGDSIAANQLNWES